MLRSILSGMGRGAREAFPRRQSIVQIAKEPTTAKQNPPGLICPGIPVLFLSHPAPCEKKVSLGWECGMLEIRGNGNLLYLPRLTVACCHRPLSPHYLQWFIWCCMQRVWCVFPHLPLSTEMPPGPTCVTFTVQTPFYCHPSQCLWAKQLRCPHPVSHRLPSPSAEGISSALKPGKYSADGHINLFCRAVTFKQHGKAMLTGWAVPTTTEIPQDLLVCFGVFSFLKV